MFHGLSAGRSKQVKYFLNNDSMPQNYNQKTDNTLGRLGHESFNFFIDHL